MTGQGGTVVAPSKWLLNVSGQCGLVLGNGLDPADLTGSGTDQYPTMYYYGATPPAVIANLFVIPVVGIIVFWNLLPPSAGFSYSPLPERRLDLLDLVLMQLSHPVRISGARRCPLP
jgi:hypothetical protein